nr:site-specific integrase [Providencia rettgeri]
MKRVVSFALLTGMRKGEILSLTWSNVNLKRKVASVTADNAKSGRGRAVPLNDDAITILNSIEKNSEHVFSVDGSKINQISRTDFAHATKLTGLDDFRFHDLRHTWASWHIQNGTPLMMLKEMGGWETLEMVNKYAHLSGEHLAKYSNTVTFLAQANIENSYPPKLSIVNS